MFEGHFDYLADVTRINMNGTVPTLVVPMLETTGPESDSRYRSLRDTIVRRLSH